MAASPLTSTLLFHIGPVAITRPVVTTWIILAVLALICRFITRHLMLRPDGRQAVLEVIVTGIMGQIEDVIRKDGRSFLPLVGTLFIFLVVANLSGVLPGVEAPTGAVLTVSYDAATLEITDLGLDAVAPDLTKIDAEVVDLMAALAP